MANKNGVHHIWRVRRGNGGYVTYCHKLVFGFDQPIDLEHAKLCVEQESYMRPCKVCLRIANRIDELNNR